MAGMMNFLRNESLLHGMKNETANDQKRRLCDLPIDQIRPNPLQPRQYFDEDDLQELATSIAELGVIQPVVVCQVENGYELIVGERRLRAAKRAGLSVIPAIITEVTPTDQQVIALVENIHRSNLSSIEEARCLQDILQRTGWNQSYLAQRLGRSQSAIANKLRLLKLEDDVQTMVLEGELGERQARALVALEGDVQKEWAQRIVDEKIPAKDVEKLVRQESSKTDMLKSNRTTQEKKQKGLSFAGPEGPTGELLKDLALLVEQSRRRGIPVVWKVKELAQRQLIVEIAVDLKEQIVNDEEKALFHESK